MSNLVVPNELTKLEREAIVKYLKNMRASGARGAETRSFEFSLPGKPPLFVKQNSDILAEASTQHFFYVLSNADKSAPRIPKVFDAFRSEEGYCFMVMEKIAAPTLSACGISEEEAVDHAAFAVKWLLEQQPSVPNSVFGRISSKESESPVWHRFFKDDEAPMAFADQGALYKYVSKAFTRCRKSAQPPLSTMEELAASFASDLCIYHCDINQNNFLLDSSNKVWIIDFQHIGLLPKAFQIYAFFNTNVFAAKVGKNLNYRPSVTSNAIAKASSVLQMSGGKATLGLDKWGNPK